MIKPGLIVSGIVHIIILALPVSVITDRLFNNDREVELFIIDTTPVVENMQKTRVSPVRQVVTEKNVQYERQEQIVYEPAPPTKKEATYAVEPSKKEAIYPVEPDVPEIIADEPAKEVRSTVTSRKPAEISSTGTISLSGAIDGISISHAPMSSTAETTSEPIETTFGLTDGPNFIHRVMPEYPPQALRLNKEDTVILLLTIDRDGRLTAVKVTKGAGYGFTEAAVKAVKNSTFRPAMKNGKPVIARAVLPIRFELRER